jgi:hypothetical protein
MTQALVTKSPTKKLKSTKLSSKRMSIRKKSRQVNKDLRSTLDSYKAKPLRAIHGLPQ